LILLDGGRAGGFCVLSLTGRRESGEDEAAVVEALALHPDCASADGLEALLSLPGPVTSWPAGA